MKLKVLAEDAFQVVGVMAGDKCPAEDFITQGEATTYASRQGLLEMIAHVAEFGLQSAPRSWTHEANKKDQIFEFIKGPLRLLFFKGEGNQIAVCTTGTRKSGAKADKAAVKKAALLRGEYLKSMAEKTCEVVEDET